MFFKPTHDNIVIKQLSKENETASGIYIPNARSNDEKNMTGEIIAVGPGRYIDNVLVKPEVAVGQKAIFSNYHAREVSSGSEVYKIVKEDKILAVF